MGLFSGILGGLAGFATGGPVGAVVGAASGFASGDSSSRTTTQSGSQSGRSTRSVSLRDWTPDEEQMYNRAYLGLKQEMMPVNDAKEAEQRQSIFDSIYNPQATAIRQTYQGAENRDYANRTARGAGNSYAKDVMDANRTKSEAEAKAGAAGAATMSAEQVMAVRKQEARARAAQYLNTITALWNNRLAGSDVTTTSSGSSSGSAVAPNSFLPSVFGAMGNAVTDDNSYLNTNILNTPAPAGTSPAQQAYWDAGYQGPVFS